VAAATPPPPSEQQQEQLAQQQQLQEQQLGAPPRAQLRSRRKGVSVLRRGGKPAAAAADKALEHALEDEEYEYQGLGPDFDAKDPRDPSRLKRPCVVPTVGGAEMYRSREVFGGGKAPILGTTDADFAPLGSGVALYFRLLFSFSLLFFVLSFLALPSIFFAAQGKRLPSTTPDSLKFARVSLGNVGPLQYDGIEKKRGDVEAEYQHLGFHIRHNTRSCREGLQHYRVGRDFSGNVARGPGPAALFCRESEQHQRRYNTDGRHTDGGQAGREWAVH